VDQLYKMSISSGLVVQKHRQLLPIKLGVAGPRVEGGRVPLAADKQRVREEIGSRDTLNFHAYEAKHGPDVVSRLDSEIEWEVPCCCRRAEMCEASR